MIYNILNMKLKIRMEGGYDTTINLQPPTMQF